MATESWMMSNAIEVLGWTLLHFVWQGAVVGVLAATLLMALRRRSANARYLTAVSALGLMFLLPLATIAWIKQTPPSGDVSPIFNTISMIEISRTREDGTLALDEPPIKVERIGIDFENPPPADAVPLIPISDTGQTILEDLAEQRSAFRVVSYLKPFIPWAVAAWLIGVGVLSLRLLASWLSVQRLRRRATQPASENWQAMLRRIAERLRVTRPVQLVESALVEVPTVIGWLSPIILLPATAMTGLTTEQLEALLAHELAHVRRHDYLVNLLQTAVETLLFYHPAVWWLSHRIRLEREHCCDDLAVQVCGDGLTYAKALVALEELRAPKLGLAMSSNGGSLLTRVARLLGQAEQQRRPTGWIAGLLSLVLLTMAGALGAGLLTPPEKPTEGLPNDARSSTTKSTDGDEENFGPAERRGQETRAERDVIEPEEPEAPRRSQTQIELEQFKLKILRQRAENDVDVRFAKASAAVAKAEWDKMLEANRKVPGSIPASEIERARLNHVKATLQIQLAEYQQQIHQLELERVLGPKQEDEAELTRKTLDLRWQAAKATADVAKAEYDKILEANRRVPGSIPDTEVERVSLAYEKALLVEVKLAVERAVAFLKAQQQENGTWQGNPLDGVTALCAAALLQAGVNADDPVMQKALAHLRTIKPTLSYTVALQTMVLCSASPKEDAELIRRNVAWLEKAQAIEGPNRGAWSYMANNTKFGDGSCSRFAMLGLHAAKKAGFEVKAETWRNASDYWMTHQKKESHAWSYQPGSTATPSMTLSGMACLAIVNQHLPQDEQTKLRTEAIERAVPFVEPNAHLLWHSGHGGYALQCLERAAHLNRWQKFGKHELRKLLDEKLIGLQRPEGHWIGIGGGGGFFPDAGEQTPEQKAAAEAARRLQVQSNDLIATSFALMCLTGQPELPRERQLKFEPREMGKLFQMRSNLIENSSPPMQRTEISGGIRIVAVEPDGSKWQIEADRVVIESRAAGVNEMFEFTSGSDVTRIECIGSVKLSSESTTLIGEKLELDLRRNGGVLNPPHILP